MILNDLCYTHGQVSIQSLQVVNNQAPFLTINDKFDCHLCEVFIEYRPTEYIAKAIRKKGY